MGTRPLCSRTSPQCDPSLLWPQLSPSATPVPPETRSYSGHRRSAQRRPGPEVSGGCTTRLTAHALLRFCSICSTRGTRWQHSLVPWPPPSRRSRHAASARSQRPHRPAPPGSAHLPADPEAEGSTTSGTMLQCGGAGARSAFTGTKLKPAREPRLPEHLPWDTG